MTKPKKETPGTNDLDFDGLINAIMESLDGVDEKVAVKVFKLLQPKSKIWRKPNGYRVQR